MIIIYSIIKQRFYSHLVSLSLAN